MSTEPPLDVDEPEKDREEQLCPNCLAPNPPSLHFCDKCNAPLSAHASIDPVGSIYAAGYVYQKAASRPRSRMTVIGMWLIFGPGAFAVFLYVCYVDIVYLRYWLGSSATDLPRLTNAVGGLTFLTNALFAVLSAAILFKVTRNYLRSRQEDVGEDDAGNGS